MPVPLDEYPIHQVPLSLEHVGTSDRGFYDRCYFNAHDRTGERFLVTGLGVYPNLGVIDAYATVRQGDRQHVVRFSDALGHDRMDARVGRYRVEVLEPLRRIRVVCEPRERSNGGEPRERSNGGEPRERSNGGEPREQSNGDEGELAFDLTWDGSFAAVQEQPHVIRHGARTILDTARFAQVGTWSGTISVAGEDVAVTPDRWLGTRDRSWGIRPVGEPEPPGRSSDEPPTAGFWWLYAPLRFDDFAVVVIVQEHPDGFRTLNDATRVWGDGRVEQLGWPRVEIGYRSGTRHPEHAVLHLTTEDGSPLVIEIDTLTSVALHVGCGYGADPEWSHGRWMGRGWSDARTYDLTDPAIVARTPFGVIDHAARAVCDGREGWGLFEHASIGRHDPTGFADIGAVAP